MVANSFLWLGRALVLLTAIASILPFMPTGAWYVRLCDFPRLQLMAIAAFAAVCLVASGGMLGWKSDIGWLIAVAVVVATWQFAHVVPYTPAWPIEVASSTGSEPETLRIVVANLQYDNAKPDQAVEVLKKSSADVLLLIEVDAAWEEKLAQLESTHPYRFGPAEDEGLGIQLWSSVELKDTEVRYLISERRASLFAVVPIGDQQFHFVGVHPTPPGLQDSTGEERRDSRVRDAELVAVAKEIQNAPDASWIVTGDFNDVAWSQTTALFKRLSRLKDPRIGRKLLTTYHSQYPMLRYPIDHVFVSDGFELVALERLFLPGSDHFAIVADLQLAYFESDRKPPDPEDRENGNALEEEGREDAKERGVEASD